MLNVLILRLIRGLEMAFLAKNRVFGTFGHFVTCLFVAKIVYSDSALGELSFGTKTGSLGLAFQFYCQIWVFGLILGLKNT